MKKYILLASRVGAYIIDYILFFVLVYIVGRHGTLWYLLCLVCFFMYRYLMTGFLGYTVGMKLLKLTLNKFDLRICFVRETARFASAFYFIGYIYGIFDSMGRTFHDIAAGTYVKYNDTQPVEVTDPFIIKPIIFVLLIISVVKWSTSFILNDIGGIGLEKVCSSDEYFQSFEGDNLISYSQEELYLNTIGRRYTAVMDFNNKPTLVKISNKLKYTEVYKLNIKGTKLIGEFAFKVNIPLQFICSGSFRNKLDLCGISPMKDIILLDSGGHTIGSSRVSLQNILSLKAGDIDGDGRAEIVVLGRNGDFQIFKYLSGKLSTIYNGKIGEDIIPLGLYVDKGLNILAKGDGKSRLYTYVYNGSGFKFTSEKYIDVKDVCNLSLLDGNLIVSNISRNSMMFRVGNTQSFEVYSLGSKVKRLYNFGKRPSRRYAFLVRNLEDVYDLNGDGQKEIVVKAVGKEDVMGNGYVVEVYKVSEAGLRVNRVLTWVENVLSFKL